MIFTLILLAFCLTSYMHAMQPPAEPTTITVVKQGVKMRVPVPPRIPSSASTEYKGPITESFWHPLSFGRVRSHDFKLDDTQKAEMLEAINDGRKAILAAWTKKDGSWQAHSLYHAHMALFGTLLPNVETLSKIPFYGTDRGTIYYYEYDPKAEKWGYNKEEEKEGFFFDTDETLVSKNEMKRKELLSFLGANCEPDSEKRSEHQQQYADIQKEENNEKAADYWYTLAIKTTRAKQTQYLTKKPKLLLSLDKQPNYLELCKQMANQTSFFDVQWVAKFALAKSKATQVDTQPEAVGLLFGLLQCAQLHPVLTQNKDGAAIQTEAQTLLNSLIDGLKKQTASPSTHKRPHTEIAKK